MPEECIDRFTKIISDVSRILLEVGSDAKRILETQAIVLFPNSSYAPLFSPEDKELMQMISQRAVYIGKVTRRHRKVPKR